MNVNKDVMNEQIKKDQTEGGRYNKQTVLDPAAEPEIAFNPNGNQETFEETYDENETAFPKHEHDEELLPGLMSSDLTSWKKQFDEIFEVSVKGRIFIVRPLNRFEYKEIIGAENTDPLMREELICEYCVLYPTHYDFTQMTSEKAGYPAILSEMIMDHSGFTRDVEVRRL